LKNITTKRKIYFITKLSLQKWSTNLICTHIFGTFLIIFISNQFCYASEQVESAIKNLKNNDWIVREDAAIALGKLNDPIAVEPLIKALDDKSIAVVCYAIESLGVIKDTRAVKPLIHLLNSQNENIKFNAGVALGKIQDPRAVEPLIAVLKNNNYFAAYALAEIDDPRGVEPIIALLKNKDQSWREIAAEVLGRMKDPRAVMPLISVLNDEWWTVTKAAIIALGEIKDKISIEPLKSILKNKEIYIDLRVAALEALAKMESPDVYKLSIGLLDDENVELQLQALKNLNLIKNLEVNDALIRKLTDWNVNSELIKTLIKLGWKPKSDVDEIHSLVALRNATDLRNKWDLAKSVLLKDIKSQNYHTVENALNAFIGIGKKEIIPILVSTIKNNGNKNMAEVYINCGDKELKKAAEDWAELNGYKVVSIPGSSALGWGSM
jgi:HEAT repeat protein